MPPLWLVLFQRANLTSKHIIFFKFNIRLFLIGQFNLGFLVSSLEIENKVMLFLIDQHAADEKFNYENLLDKIHPSPQQLVQ